MNKISENIDETKYLPYSAAAVANFILDKAEVDGESITCMHINKLVYLCFGWATYHLNAYLYKDLIEAWKYGPVLPKLYHELKRFGGEPITEKALDTDYKEDGTLTSNPATLASKDETMDKKTKNILTNVWNEYKLFTASQLVEYTHTPGSPWALVYKKDVDGIEIRKAVIKDYFFWQVNEYMKPSEEKQALVSS